MTTPADQLAEAIEELRRFANYEQPIAPLAASILAVCDAAARCAEAERERDAIRGAGDEACPSQRDCTDCGRRMVWSRASPAASWMCPGCVYDRMRTAERERDELKINVASRILCSKDADSHLRRVVAERDEARATLAGIERLLLASWQIGVTVGDCFYFVTPDNDDLPKQPTLAAAVAAAVAELGKETT